ncbi:hypothetical protein OPV22_013696 [Ensete ventricosum]|uniref:Uncharacterized protein n=1 Tax=Ensete ventricosum TaxID=4639 RepID=A0AAV8R611_ENSVE|nr:hypothetical protein OPV22_013696 [Ensete ventricosum]
MAVAHGSVEVFVMRCGDPESVTEPDPARPDPDRANRTRLPVSISMKTTLSRSPLMIAAHWRRHQGIRSGADPWLLIWRG